MGRGVVHNVRPILIGQSLLLPPLDEYANVMSSQSIPPMIRWKPVLGLAAVQAAITLTWVIYGAYLPNLLAQFGMAPQVSAVLLSVENGLAIALYPLMGRLSDRNLRWVGTRFPFIAVGVGLASALFLSIPAIALFGTPSETLRWLVIFLLVSWALAMTIFHSPVVSLLFIYSNVDAIPLAASGLTFARYLVGTAVPLVNQALIHAGAGVTFAVGSFSLLGAVWALRQVGQPEPLIPPPESPQPLPLQELRFVVIAIVGLGIGFGNQLIFGNVATLFSTFMPGLNTGYVMTGLSIGIAIIAVPFGWLATRFGNDRLLITGLIGGGLCAIVMMALPQPTVLMSATVGLAIALSLIFNGAFPFAFGQVIPSQAGLGIGLYLGGLSAASTLFGATFKETALVPPPTGAWVGAIAFGVVALSVGLTQRFPQATKAG
jgi:MFS family permease